ncbi:MAG: ferredoxin--NADP reductase [Spirosomataceae bacterium]
MTPDTRPLRIAQITTEVPDVKTFVLEPTDPSPFLYQSGQFLTLLFNHHDQEIRRSFSFSSTPSIDPLPTITVKRVPNGLVSRQLLDHAQVGDTLMTLPPAGRFVVKEKTNSPRQVFLIGAGSGITPLFSLLKQLLHEDPLTQIVLIYSNKTKESTIFYKQLQLLQDTYPNHLKVIFLWGNAKNLLYARLSSFLLEEIVNAEVRFVRKETLFYTCGPEHYMLMVQITLLTMGFEKSQIHHEFYTIEPKAPTPKNYPMQTAQFSFRGKTQTITVKNNQTILEAGLEAKLALPYTCRAGRCGACVALCTNGRVEMEYNEVLTDEEISLGQVLTCMAHPTTADVTIRW